jgi:hypothetical protein
MGISWNIHKNENLIYIHLFGQSSLLESVDALRELGADADFSPDMRRIYVCDNNLEAPPGLDSTQGAFVDVLGRQVARMFNPPATVAFVYAQGNQVAAGRFAVTARVCNEIYAAAGAPPMNYGIFHDVPSALTWLELPPDFDLGHPKGPATA